MWRDCYCSWLEEYVMPSDDEEEEEESRLMVHRA